MSLLCFANIILPDMRHLVRKNPYATSAELSYNLNGIISSSDKVWLLLAPLINSGYL